MKNVYIAKIDYYTDDDKSWNLTYCIFNDKDQATAWIKHHRNLLEEDLYLCKEMDHILWSTASARERNKGYISHKNVTDYVESYEKYRLSPFGRIDARGYGYWIHAYEIGKAKGDAGSYYEFGEPVIDIDRVEQKLKEYKQHREEIRK